MDKMAFTIAAVMTPSFPELQAFAELLREEKCTVNLCLPGTTELPLCKSPICRLACYITTDTYTDTYEIVLRDDKLIIKKLIAAKHHRNGCSYAEEDTPEGVRPRSITIHLADPDSPKQAAKIMREWV